MKKRKIVIDGKRRLWRKIRNSKHHLNDGSFHFCILSLESKEETMDVKEEEVDDPIFKECENLEDIKKKTEVKNKGEMSCFLFVRKCSKGWRGKLRKSWKVPVPRRY